MLCDGLSIGCHKGRSLSVSCLLGILVGGRVMRVWHEICGMGCVLCMALFGIALRVILLCGASGGSDFRFRRLYGCVGLSVFG